MTTDSSGNRIPNCGTIQRWEGSCQRTPAESLRALAFHITHSGLSRTKPSTSSRSHRPQPNIIELSALSPLKEVRAHWDATAVLRSPSRTAFGTVASPRSWGQKSPECRQGLPRHCFEKKRTGHRWHHFHDSDRAHPSAHGHGRRYEIVHESPPRRTGTKQREEQAPSAGRPGNEWDVPRETPARNNSPERRYHTQSHP